MGKEIIINTAKEQTRIAILEDGDLVELYFENTEHERTLGNIFLGRVRRIMPSIKAAFVDIGQKQDAFLHFSDLSEDLPAWFSYLKQENPAVERVHIDREANRPVVKRRRPKDNRVAKTADINDEALAEGSERAHHSVVAAQTRGKRRSVQRHSGSREDGRKKSGEGSSKGKGRRSDDNAPRGPRPETYLSRDQRILVKISKEPISAKGSRVTTDISLAGRFLVLVPLANYVAVSKKIQSYKERRRLRTLAKSLLPAGFGVIVRTVAEGKNAKALDTDLRLLVEKWRKIEQKLAGNPTPPLLVHEDVNMASSVIRDLFSDDYDRILADDPRVHRNIKNYIQAVAPHMVPAVRLHKDAKPVFEAAGIARDVADVFESRLNLPSGGYLFIEQTEAMHVVDVNSGRAGKGLSQEQNSLRVNLEAARAIAKQVRLRDLGGIIVVDFIDMREEKNRRKVLDEMRKEFRKDRAVTKFLPMSDFGLMQITRQRLRPSITKTFGDTNGNGAAKSKALGVKAARGHQDRGKSDSPRESRPREKEAIAGVVASPESLVQDIELGIVGYRKEGNEGPLRLRVHPFTAAYLKRGLVNCIGKWRLKHHVRVHLETDDAVQPMGFRNTVVQAAREESEVV